MISPRLLRVVLIVEVAVATACLCSVVLHGLWLWRRRRADARLLGRAQAALAAPIDADELDEGRVAELRGLPRRVQREAVEQLAVSVTGPDGARLGRVAETLGLVAAAKRRCRSRRWGRRLLGAHQLNVYGHGDEVLDLLFDDHHPAVRAQAIEWAADSRLERVASRLVSSLQDPSALCRNTGADGILRAGATLVEALARELAERGGQDRADLLVVLARRPDPRYGPVALVAVTDDLPAVRAAAAGLLGGVGGAEAAIALKSLLVDADATVRAAAADGIRRLGHQLAAPDLAPLLRDPSFDVRRAAGAALAALGPGGVLLLRHYLADEDRFAADMARYSLDIAALRAPAVGRMARP